MSTSVRKSRGDLPLETLESAIATFEMGFAKFLSCNPIVSGGKNVNEITFENIDLELSLDFKLSKNTGGSLGGYDKIWSGKIYVDNSLTEAIAWRKKE